MSSAPPSSSGNDHAEWPAGTRYFTQITPENHAGWLYIITLMSFVYVTIAALIRFVVKRGIYGLDDWSLLGSTVIAVGQYGAVLAALSQGLGKSSSLLGAGQKETVEKYTASHIYLYILSQTLSKLSTALLVQRLFENTRRRNAIFCWVLIAVCACYGLGCILCVSISCDDIVFPAPEGHSCPSRFTRWRALLILDITSELFLVLIPLGLVYDILLRPRSKFAVFAVFAFRLGDVVLAALNLAYIAAMEKSAPSATSIDYGIKIIPALMYTQAELLWSIIAASLPCLKMFIRPFDTVAQDGDGEGEYSRSGYASQPYGVGSVGGAGGSYGMQSSGAWSWRSTSQSANKALPGPTMSGAAVPLEDMRGQKRSSLLSCVSPQNADIVGERTRRLTEVRPLTKASTLQGEGDEIGDDDRRGSSWESRVMESREGKVVRAMGMDTEDGMRRWKELNMSIGQEGTDGERHRGGYTLKPPV